jgi:subtilisin-like proprotein convertase family protein
MLRTRLLPVVAMLLGLALVAPAGSAAQLELKVASFDPLQGLPPLPDSLRLESESPGGYFVVQLRGPVVRDVLGRLRAAGAEPLKYLPERAYLVRLRAGSASAVRAMPEVRWLGEVQPGWKLAPDLGTRPYLDPSRRQGGRLYATADLFPGEDAQPVVEAARATGADVIQVIGFATTRRLKLSATLDQLHRIARIPAVAWIEELGEITLRNNTTRWVIQTNVVDSTTVWDHGLRGEGQIIGHIDSRVDMNSCYFRDPADNTPGPAHRKVVAYRSSTGTGASSHGTHTAGTAAGDQFPINGTINGNGNAYAAKLSYSNLNDITGSGTQASNLYQYLEAAHGDGARQHTNSWGDDGTTAYTTWCVDIDQFSYDYEDSLVLFAVTNTSTLKTPENAKNVLAVGASANGTSSGNFCSGGRGPTSDGRRKPEIYAPGCSIVSARSASECSTTSQTGTSMASPAVTAAAALVRQYFVEGFYPSGAARVEDALVPSGALIKATLLNSAVDMTGISGYPSNQEGWGRVLLENALYFDGDLRRLSVLADLRNAQGLGTGQEATYPLVVEGSGERLRITLVFTEPAAALLAADATVNDLDLEVVTPSGQTYLGNVIDTATGRSVLGGAPDPDNNVEMVILDAPEAGEWTVRVRGAAVNEGTQGYALVASGEVQAASSGPLRYVSHLVQDAPPLGNADGIVDPGETVTMPVTLRNASAVTVTGISAELIPEPGAQLRLTQDTAAYPDLPPDTTAESLSPHYRYTVAPDAACGTVVRLKAQTASSEGAGETSFEISVGQSHLDAPAPGLPLSIPKTTPGVVSTNDVSQAFTIRDVHVAVDIAHGNVGELRVDLTSPAGTTVTLHNHSGEGTADLVTVYDRQRSPDGPGGMNDFNGQQAQGSWRLTVVDDRAGPTPKGTLRAWTLELDATLPLSCTPLACGGDPVPGEVAPDMVLARENATGVRLSWSAVAGATAYRVWKSATPAFADEEFVGSTSETTFVDSEVPAEGETWYYEVRAINSCEWEGP